MQATLISIQPDYSIPVRRRPRHALWISTGSDAVLIAEMLPDTIIVARGALGDVVFLHSYVIAISIQNRPVHQPRWHGGVQFWLIRNPQLLGCRGKAKNSFML